jgi:pimeloyl-ACP methyl ester carboxylesterase
MGRAGVAWLARRGRRSAAAMTMGETFLETPRGRFHALALDGDAALPLLVFAHATGMCAAVYAGLIERLAGMARVIAFDARGHGRTEAVERGECLADWAPFRADLAAIIEALGEGPVLLAGHSFGGTVAAETAHDRPDLVSALLMIEPAFIPFAHAADYRTARRAGQHPPNPMADRAARRRAAFASVDEMRASFSGRGVFADWPGAALEAYLAAATRPSPSGIELACTPECEASVFRGVSTTLEQFLHGMSVPLALVHGTVGSTVTAEDAARIAAMGHQVHDLEGAGHFVPVTEPERVFPFLADFAVTAAPARPQRRAER